jgi:hypothetical protein
LIDFSGFLTPALKGEPEKSTPFPLGIKEKRFDFESVKVELLSRSNNFIYLIVSYKEISMQQKS